MLCFFASSITTITSATPIRRPGTIPAMNISAMDVPVMEAYTTKAILGGMTMAMELEVAISAVENGAEKTLLPCGGPPGRHLDRRGRTSEICGGEREVSRTAEPISMRKGGAAMTYLMGQKYPDFFNILIPVGSDDIPSDSVIDLWDINNVHLFFAMGIG